MSVVKAADVKRGIAVIWENLQCPICLDLMSEPVSTRCDHQFCKFCMTKLLERNKRKETNCPVCKTRVTKRSLQESPGFQKLVEGLQKLVRSYEFDTCTNYFTGLPQRRQGASVETESRDQQGSGENTTPEGEVMEKEATVSSTTAAKDAFAKLMCLEDSLPAMAAEHDQLDSSLGDLPEKSEINPADPDEVLPRTEDRYSQVQHDVTPDNGKCSRKRSKRLCMDPDRIVDKRQKKSVEKVSEWLLKISPSSDAQTETNMEGNPPVSPDRDAEGESSASHVSLDVAKKKADVSPVRDVPSRGLEEQVFGAVYKRDRKGVKVTKSFSAEREIAPVVYSEQDERIEIPKRRSSRKLTPADFIRNTNKDKKDREDQEEVAEENKKPSDEQEKDGPDGNTEGSPEFEVPVKKPGRRSKIQEVWQDMDRDLTEKDTNTKKDRKRRITRSSCDATKDDNLDEGKHPKSLALVSGGTEIVDLKLPSNPKLIEMEVNIESYPSSAEPKAPDSRKTRRSLRLQEFTSEVQSVPRRRRISKPALSKPPDEPEHSNPDDPRVKTNHIGTGQTSQSERSARGNGCVYNNDFEIMQSGEDAAAPKCVSEGTGAEDNSLISVVPDTVDQDKPVRSSSTKVTNSISPLVAQVQEALPQESPSMKTLTPTVEQEDTNDSELDTEQLMKTFKGTKRKSFYLGSPRRSRSKTREQSLTQVLEEDKQERVDQAEKPYISPDGVCHSGLPKNGDNCEVKPHEITSETSQSCTADVASVSLLQVKSPAPGLQKVTQKDISVKASGATDQSEKVARSQESSPSQDSRPPMNAEPLNSIQLFSTSVTQEEPHISCRKDSTNSSEIQEKQFQPDFDVDPNKIPSIPLTNCQNFESSVTPDGLVPNGPEEPPTSQNLDKMNKGEILSQPRLRRKRKAQRLESSDSESSAEDEDLPSLAQIFKSHQSASPPTKTSSNHDGLRAEGRDPKPGLDPVSQGSRSRSEPETRSSLSSQCIAPYQRPECLRDVNSDTVQDGGVCDLPGGDEWVTSSQGSVDLFGTPRDGEDVGDGVCGNAGLSIEASQYSSEIVTTQQREEMQHELHRLERMMALVSEALQKKDGNLDEKSKKEVDDQDSGQQTRMRSQRSCKSGRQPSQRSEVKGHSVVPEDVTANVMVEKRLSELRGETLGERPLKNECRTEPGVRMELVVSGLSASEQGLVKRFARKMDAGVSSQVTPTTTHIIIKTDADLVCERTLKYFQGIAGRKWVVSFTWISECFRHSKLLPEALYEVCGDVVNGLNHNGPQKARTAPDDDLLMKGCEICFQGSFTDMTTDQMEVMVELCGATVMKDPLMFSRKGIRHQLVVVQPDPDDSQSYYAALQRKATVVTRSWLLDSIATYTLQNPHHYKP